MIDYPLLFALAARLHEHIVLLQQIAALILHHS